MTAFRPGPRSSLFDRRIPLNLTLLEALPGTAQHSGATMKRRTFLAGTIAFAALPLSPTAGYAASPQELLKAGALPEMSFGRDDAPVTVIEYASLTCPHCRSFHMNTWPTIKERY